MIDSVLLVTFHGGSGGVNNVGAYADNGAQLTLEVLQGAPSGLLSEIRGLALVSDGLMWVASGSKRASLIAAFEGAGQSYAYKATVAQFGPIASLWHPFDFTLDGAGNCYVSNQDTDVVARLTVAADLLSATAAPLAPALPSGGTFLPATFVASSDGALPGVSSTTAVATPAGLEVAFDSSGNVANSVRGVAWTNDVIYVADEVAGLVKVYDADGTYLGASNDVEGPVHLLVAGETSQKVLYVSSGSQVLSSVLDASQPATLNLEPIPAIAVPKVSGMAIGPENHFYAASRDGKGKVYRYKNFPSAPDLDHSFSVADLPEFVMYVPDPG
jgi:hypothetical protein